MSFDAALKATALEVDRLLDRLLPLDAAPARRLIEAMRYAALGAGKRLRPFLLIESARLCGADHGRAVRAGAALECVHGYSLAHDDLPAMDNDDLRRGRPTAHRAFDEATAILAGDGLLTLAFEVLSDPATHPDAAVRCELISGLARAAGKDGMVGGQMLDLQASQGASDPAQVAALQGLKTGALFRFACEAGAILALAPAGTRAALRQYADKIGLAFQIADDVLDVESSPAALGKRTAKDDKAGKATLVGLIGLDGAKAEAVRLAEEAVALLPRGPGTASWLSEAARFIATRRR